MERALDLRQHARPRIPVSVGRRLSNCGGLVVRCTSVCRYAACTLPWRHVRSSETNLDATAADVHAVPAWLAIKIRE